MLAKFLPFSPFEDDEEVFFLQEYPKGLPYMEQLNKYLSKLQKVKNISEDILMEPVQHPCMVDYLPYSDEDIDQIKELLTD